MNKLSLAIFLFSACAQAGLPPLAIQNQGTTVTPLVYSINFAGTGVTTSATGGVVTTTINSGSGAVVAMDAVKAGGSVSANTTIPTWSVTTLDTNSGFNASTGVYTVAVAGNYYVTANVTTTTGTPEAEILKNGTQISSTSLSGNQGTTNSRLLAGLIIGDNPWKYGILTEIFKTST